MVKMPGCDADDSKNIITSTPNALMHPNYTFSKTFVLLLYSGKLKLAKKRDSLMLNDLSNP